MLIRTSPHQSSSDAIYQPRLISELIESSDNLSELCKHIQKLNSLQTKLRLYLGPPLDEHVIIADYRQNILVFHADSAAWATKLRYRTPDILKHFTDDLPGIRTIRIKNPPVETRVEKIRNAAKASPGTVDAIRQVAARITDTPLRDALLRIAETLQQK